MGRTNADPNFGSRPFAAGALTGIRAWQVQGTVNKPLEGLFHHQEWGPGVNVSFCDNKPALKNACWKDHEEDPRAHVDDCYFDNRCGGVEMKCGCGFWAYTNGRNDYYRGMIGQGGIAHVSGIIQGFGKCVVGPKGFRAEKAIIKCLILPARMHTRMVSDQTMETVLQRQLRRSMDLLYPGIPIFSDEEIAMAEYPLTLTEEEEQPDEQGMG